MCGIAGVMTADGSAPPERLLDALEAALAHRGPDGKGRHVGGGVGLLQTRLAIIDLKTGDQPLYAPDRSVLVANGEIYNYVELKQEFRETKFATQSDCELPLATFAREGADFAKPLRGMYAIALADPTARTTYLSRDPFGIKPLYYAEFAGGVVFASEPQAILKTGLVARSVRRDAAVELAQLQFTTGGETIFAGIKRVLPGETLTLRDGKIGESRMKPALPSGPPIDIREDQALNLLEDALMNSVMVHQRSDVPYGMFLSGGIDSSALLTCMAKLNDKPVRAFTAGFPGTEARDEREQAKRVAKACGAEHIEVEVGEQDFWNHLPAIAAAMDDPAADYAIVPTYLLAREAAKQLKVVLTGEGGDELFAGYGRYRSALRPAWLGGRKMRRKGIFDGLGVLREESRGWRNGIAAVEHRIEKSGSTPLQQAQALDCADWLPNDLLIKLDRCLMAHGLEGRTPFLDPIIAKFAFRLPDRLKVAKGMGKYLLRKWLSETLPEADAFSKKRGFTVPVAEWIAPRARKLAPLIASSPGVAEICLPDRVQALFGTFGDRGGKREGTACWQLLFYALWHRAHGEGRSPVGDVFAVLGA